MNPVTTATSKATYQTPDLVQLLRRPDSLRGQRLTLRGRVVQTWDDEGEATVILRLEGPGLPIDPEVAVTLAGGEGPLPQGEVVVWGVCRGTHVELHGNRCGAVARPHLEAERVE